MGLHLFDVYRSPNIGVFMKGNDKLLLVPKGLAETKTDKLSEYLGTPVIPASVGESRLLGPLICMNGNGALVSRLADDTEVAEIRSATGLNVSKLESRFTAVGNLVAANDRRALLSPLLDDRAATQVREVMGTEVERVAMGQFHQVGALVVATNTGAAVYPGLGEEEVSVISKLLGVDAYPTSINGGVPFVASGLVANSRNAVAGSQTTGPELVFITRALSV